MSLLEKKFEEFKNFKFPSSDIKDDNLANLIFDIMELDSYIAGLITQKIQNPQKKINCSILDDMNKFIIKFNSEIIVAELELTDQDKYFYIKQYLLKLHDLLKLMC